MKKLGFLYHFASYIMRGRQQAIVVALLFTILPLFGWVSNAIVALITLRQGAKEGAIVLLWVILPAVVAAGLGNRLIILYGIIGGSLFTYVLALALRQTQSWKVVLTLSALLGIIAVVLVHVLVPHVSALWQAQFDHYVTLIKSQFRLAVNVPQLHYFSKFATGFQVAIISLSVLVNLVFARALQSMLYNPGQLRPELENIRLNKWTVFLLLVVFLLCSFRVTLAQDILFVVSLIFILAGLSLLHFVAHIRKINRLWFLLFYLLLMVVFPYMAAFLILLAILDSIFDLRYRSQPRIKC